MIFALCFTITVFLCSLPTGMILLTWMHDINPQQHGSKNIGMSNVWRIKGAFMGGLTLVGDLLKSYVALHISAKLGVSDTMLSVIGVTAVLSHCYSIYLRGRGGKGVATAGGVLLYTTPYLCLGLAFLWFITRKISQKASIASLITSIFAVIISHWYASEWSPMILVLLLIIFWRHKENLSRIRSKTELSSHILPVDPL
ncbi:MAG: glycerol-3-phosphate acyltransferase [Myxococcota bacterium]|nr:glycerol-3-phosphate acyltransferase [Myxococcota bacterium]